MSFTHRFKEQLYSPQRRDAAALYKPVPDLVVKASANGESGVIEYCKRLGKTSIDLASNHPDLLEGLNIPDAMKATVINLASTGLSRTAVHLMQSPELMQQENFSLSHVRFSLSYIFSGLRPPAEPESPLAPVLAKNIDPIYMKEIELTPTEGSDLPSAYGFETSHAATFSWEQFEERVFSKVVVPLFRAMAGEEKWKIAPRGLAGGNAEMEIA